MQVSDYRLHKQQSEKLCAAIAAGAQPENWSKKWTCAEYGVAEHVERLIADDDSITLEAANRVLADQGWEQLGPDMLPFAWGGIVRIHRVGDHAIVESDRDDGRFYAYVRFSEGASYYSTSSSFKSSRTLAPGRRQVNLLGTRKREHSRKPDELYPIIESCSPGPRLELFARYPQPGWEAWGNEAPEDVTPRGRQYPIYAGGLR
jgi:hypothetical protein